MKKCEERVWDFWTKIEPLNLSEEGEEARAGS